MRWDEIALTGAGVAAAFQSTGLLSVEKHAIRVIVKHKKGFIVFIS